MSWRSPADLAVWQRLGDENYRTLIAQIGSLLARDGHPTPAQLSAWRKAVGDVKGVEPAHFVAAAVELVRARRASGWKFRDAPPAVTPLRPVRELILDVQGGEQATAWPIARHKAVWIAQRLGAGAPIIDACCGVGADAREFVIAGLDTQGVDFDPVRAWMCRRNADVPTDVADVASTTIGAAALHIDPGRRTESRSGARARLHTLDDLLPSISVVAALAASASQGACVKLGPGVNPFDLPPLKAPTSLEYISLDGQLSQAVWRTGPLADQLPIRATMLNDDGIAFTFAIDPAHSPESPAEHPIGSHIYTVDAAIERAGLLPALASDVGLAVVHPALGLLTSSSSAGAPLEHPALTAFAVRETMPWRRERVVAWLQEHGAGIVDVKTRGKACDPDIEQRELRGEGPTPFCVFILRFGDALRAIITERA